MTTEEFIDSIKLDGEEWKTIPGWENLYYVSTFGRLARAKSKTWPNSLITPYKMHRRKKVYLGIKLQHNGFRGHYSVHRLVALTFVPNPNNYPCIDHIDCNSTNNHVSNLKWCTRSMNNMNPISRQRESESHLGIPNTVQNRNVVQLKDGKLVKIYRTMTDPEKEDLKFSHAAIHRVCNGKALHHKGFQWMYLEDYNTLINKSKNPLSNTSDYPQYEPPLNP